LRLRVNDLIRHFVEPHSRQFHVAYATPELSDEVSQHGALVAGDAVE
jgi:hypothetical protein